jgi:hypothetical protein
MKKEFNVNHKVYVKLTEVGLKELERQHQELLTWFPKAGPFVPPKTDAEGFSQWQLHSLMSSLGHLMQLGCEVPFETNIYFEVQKE